MKLASCDHVFSFRMAEGGGDVVALRGNVGEIVHHADEIWVSGGGLKLTHTDR